MRHRISLLAVLAAVIPLIGLAADEHGHDHDAAAPVNANGPQRRPDGSVFLPKPAQRQIVVRTFVAEEQVLLAVGDKNQGFVVDVHVIVLPLTRNFG